MSGLYREGTTPNHVFVRHGALVHELASGETLAAAVARGFRADEAAARALAGDALEILVHLHALPSPAIHRGLSPSSIVLRREGGIALTDPAAARAEGTAPDYVAPEQFRTAAVPASDLYSLAATLLTAMTGLAPGQLPQKKLTIDFRPHLRTSSFFADWLERMLAPAPEDRFLSAGSALAVLRRGTGARRETTGRGRGRLYVLSGLLAIVVVGAGIFVTLTELRERKERRAEALRSAGRPTLTGHVLPLDRLPAEPLQETPLVQAVGIPAHFSAVHAAAFSRDGKTLVTGSFDGTVKSWTTATGAALRTFGGHTGRVGSVAIAADGALLVTAGDRTVRVWNLDKGSPVRSIEADARQATHAAVTSDGKVAVSAGFDGTAKAWNLADGTLVQTYPHSPGKGRLVTAVLSTDETLVLTGGEDSTVKVWNRTTGALERTITGHESGVNAIAVAPDGQTIVTASDDRTVRVWHARSGAPIHAWRGHTDEVWNVAISPDGALVASAGADDSLQFHELVSGKSRGERSLPGEKTLGLAFSPDGTRIATGTGRGVARLWAIRGKDLGTKVPRPPSILPDRVSKEPASEEEHLYLEAKAEIDAWSGESLAHAETLLRQVLAKNERHAPAYVGLARIEMDRGYIAGDEWKPENLRAAHVMLDRADALAPRLPAAWISRARVYNAQKDAANTTRVTKELEAMAPDDPDVVLVLAVLASDRHDWDEAERRATAILSRPVRASVACAAYGILGDVYEARGDTGAEKQTYELALEADPDRAWSMGNFAQFLSREGDQDAAIAMAKRALARRDYGHARHTLARAYARKGVAELWGGNAEAGKASFDAALAENPREVMALYGRGAYYRWTALGTKDPRHAAESKRAFEAALAASPDFALARAALAEHPRLEEAIRK